MFKRLFIDHPQTVQESYLQHMSAALCFAASMAKGSIALLIHALIPSLCAATGRRTVEALHARMLQNRIQTNKPFK